jgi:uncharacterized membrane protein YtjA (UPF0391 family)
VTAAQYQPNRPGPSPALFRWVEQSRRIMVHVPWSPQPAVERSSTMLKWALIFFVISLIAGALGFSGISAGAAQIAKVLFFIFLVIFVIFLVLGLMAGQAIL